MSFTCEAVQGMPRFIRHAVNTWSVHPIDDAHCIVRTHAELQLAGITALLAPPLRLRMPADGNRVLDELRHRVERGQRHPRKLAAISAAT